MSLDLDNRMDLIFVVLNIGDFDSGDSVFRAITSGCRKGLARVWPQLPSSVRMELDRLVESVQVATEWYGVSEGVRAFLSMVRDLPIGIVIVLDDFDRASTVFGRLAEFQLLRNVASESFSSAGVVTISRRPVSIIEIDAIGGSTLDGVLSLRCVVGQFPNSDIEEMLARGDGVGATLSTVRSDLVDRTGGHPFLLELLCNAVVDVFSRTGEYDVSTAFGAVRDQFNSQFQRMVTILNSDSGGRASEVLGEILNGESDSVRRQDLELLTRLSLLQAESGSVRLFSRSFESYLRSVGIG